MIASVLKRIESGWIRIDWKDCIDKVQLTDSELETILDLIDNFKSNRKAKDVAIFKYRFLPVYACVQREEFMDLLDWIFNQFISREVYEVCTRIVEIKKKLQWINLKK